MAKVELATEIDEQGFKFLISVYDKGVNVPLKRDGRELVFRDVQEAEAKYQELMMERYREDMAVPYTTEEAKDFLRRYRHLRKFAKTYANTAPHSYYIKEWFDEQGKQDFERFIAFFKKNKVEGRFYQRAFYFCVIGNEYFFPMGYDNLAMDIINVNTIDNLELRNGIYYYKRNDI